MAKVKKIFVCRSCGAVQARWMGKCPDCGTWDSLDEETLDPNAAKDPQRGLVAGWDEKNGGDPSESASPVALPISQVDANAEPTTRISCGILEFDRVLGGGIVPGSAVLLGGEPGIGKSTLLLQAAYSWAAKGAKVLYVSSEESARQIRMRAERLAEGRDDKDPTRRVGVPKTAEQDPPRRGGPPQGNADDSLFLLSDTNLARIVEQTRKVLPQIVVIDSVQMLYKSDLSASPGSVTQLRRCCAELVYLAKASGIAVVLVGHVTKEGTLAGPRLLEHLVDAVLYFEGDRYHSHRVVRAIKNRFGTTLEIGLFEMTGRGLQEVPEGSGVPAATIKPRPGSVVCPVLTGTRCLLVELQALTATGFPGAAKRKCSGLDTNRLAMLIAVLEQHAEMRLFDRDVFTSSVGGVRIVEPASDLALLLAIAGSHLRRSLSAGTAAVGEVGLGGEIRPVPQIEQRLREAARLGYTKLLVPSSMKLTVPKGLKIELMPVASVNEAVQRME
jgi:DNA repair protein RadA/Sms